MTGSTIRINATFALWLWLFLLPLVAEARLFRAPTPDELAKQAPVICNGQVVSIANSLVKGVVGLPNASSNFSVPIEYWTAQVKVLGVAKGKLPDEFEFRFPQIDQHPGPRNGMMDGPMQIRLMPGKRYRFYLKDTPGQTYYVGVLDGQFDDAFAVQPLAAAEPDDSGLPLTRDEALERATAYVEKYRPGANNTPGSPEASQWMGKWTIRFWWPPEVRQKSLPGALIEIVGNGLIDPESFVTDGSVLTPQTLTDHDIGQDCLLYVKPDPDDQFYNTFNPGSNVTLRGRLTKFSAAEVDLADACRWQWKDAWPTLAIPAAEIKFMSRLIPAATPEPAIPR